MIYLLFTLECAVMQSIPTMPPDEKANPVEAGDVCIYVLANVHMKNCILIVEVCI